MDESYLVRSQPVRKVKDRLLTPKYRRREGAKRDWATARGGLMKKQNELCRKGRQTGLAPQRGQDEGILSSENRRCLKAGRQPRKCVLSL